MEHKLTPPAHYSQADWTRVVYNDLLSKGRRSATYRRDYRDTFGRFHPDALAVERAAR